MTKHLFCRTKTGFVPPKIIKQQDAETAGLGHLADTPIAQAIAHTYSYCITA